MLGVLMSDDLKGGIRVDGWSGEKDEGLQLGY